MNAPETKNRITPEGYPIVTAKASRRYGGATTATIILGFVLLAVLIGWLIFRAQTQPPGGTTPGGASGGRRGAAPAVMPVGVATVRQADVNVYLDGLGAVTPRATVTVHTRVAGQLMRVAFTEGQMVKQGDLLAEVDPRPYEAALEQAEGQLKHDQALLADARLDLQRYKTLFEQDSIAKQTLDTQEALVEQYVGSVKSDQGVVDTAHVNLIYTKITAPVGGRVGLRQVDAGNIIQPTDSNGIVVITQLQPIDVVFTVPQDDIPRVVKPMKSGQAVLVDTFDRDQKIKLDSGKLLTIDNQIDVTTGTVKLKATFENQDLALFPNQFVNVRMLVDVMKSALVVPVAAVQRGSQGTYSYIVKPDSTVTVSPVKMGPSEGDRVSILSGLKAGDVVVTDGSDKLREGAKVEAVDRSKQPVGAAPAAPGASETNPGVQHHRHRDQPSGDKPNPPAKDDAKTDSKSSS
ncbi:MAG: MdtA/MuxA family multidrug efflux RND transporter periplasmic adaptor subunit [Burkholderiaceae bacterium]|jgi:multidrug efflux system membrane fusion protein